ncbi:MAG TPA: hypothetical protein VFD33_02935 [Bacillota bacterium]|nr:hypothetical protein [Bacillota bacterium]
MIGLSRLASFIMREVPGKVIEQVPKVARGVYHGILGSEASGEIMEKGVRRATEHLSRLVESGADESIIKAAKESVKAASNPGWAYHASKVVGAGSRHVSKGAIKAGKVLGKVATSEPVKDMGRDAAKILFTKSEEGPHIGNLFTGRELSKWSIGAAEVAGLGIVLGTAGSRATQATAVQSQAGNRMPQLSYGGGIPHDHLGASGDLALALHHNRHG